MVPQEGAKGLHFPRLVQDGPQKLIFNVRSPSDTKSRRKSTAQTKNLDFRLRVAGLSSGYALDFGCSGLPWRKNARFSGVFLKVRRGSRQKGLDKALQ